jgi:hypothetical protein
MDIEASASGRRRRDSEQTVVSPSVLSDNSEKSHDRKRSNKHRRNKKSISSRRRDFRYFVDNRGRQHFNFKQEIWLDSSVQMAFTRVYSVALKTLAVNLLTLATEGRDIPVAIGNTSRSALVLAASFSRQCLMGAPDKAWALPRATIEEWIASRRRRARSRGR